MEAIREITQKSEILGIIVFVLPFIARVLFAVAINLDCRAKNIGARKIYTILSIFFPVVGGIFYAFKRKTAPKAFKVCKTCGNQVGTYTNTCPHCGGLFLAEYENPKKKTLEKVSIIICVLAIISYAVPTAIDIPDYSKTIKEYISGEENPDNDYYDEYENDDVITGSDLCYDRDGRAYSNEYAVLYHNRDGAMYKHIYDDGEDYFMNTKSGNRIQTNEAFVDSEGYFVVIKEGLTHVENDPYTYTISADNESEAKAIDVTYQDEDGNVYYLATEASWNYSGNLLICGNTLN